jgi:tRNA pseudouridine55 synthase
VLCSKGTYVRVLAEDLAAALGTLGHVSTLRREYVEPFEGEAMRTLESLTQARAAGAWPALLAPDRPLGHLPAVHLEPEQVRRVCQGQAVRISDGPRGTRVRLYDASRFFGIAETDVTGAVHPRRLLRPEASA